MKVVSENFCKKMIFRFGTEVQTRKVQEECLELALAISQFYCPTKDSSKMIEKVVDEIADGFIVLAQARLLFGADSVDKRIAEKIQRATELYLKEGAE